MSVLYIGAYSWSYSYTELPEITITSNCEATFANDVSVHASSSKCLNCVASSTGQFDIFGANAYGGSMSVLYIGAYSWSSSNAASSSSRCDATTASGVAVHVSNSECFNCSALVNAKGYSSEPDIFGANTYGGSISASYIGAYSYSFTRTDIYCISSVADTRVVDFSVAIMNATFADTAALSGEHGRTRLFQTLSH
jgi:hypothetical protein